MALRLTVSKQLSPLPSLPPHSATCPPSPTGHDLPEARMATSRPRPRSLPPFPPCSSVPEVKPRMGCQATRASCGVTTHSPQLWNCSPACRLGTCFLVCLVTGTSALIEDSLWPPLSPSLLLSLGLEPGWLWEGGVRRDHVGPAVNMKRGGLGSASTSSTPESHSLYLFIRIDPKGLRGHRNTKSKRRG